MNSNIEFADSIIKLKNKKDALILAHNYQIGEVQDIADFVGDSLQLSIEASKTKNKIIVFCGVCFMAETAKILSPEKKVLLPDTNSGCPMADMITASQLGELKNKYPDAVVVCYVNSSAEVKALSDICCTSSNAIDIVKSIPKNKRVIFIPDKYLGSYVRSETKREMILWDGYCPVHVLINVKNIIQFKKEHLDAPVIAHPECTPDVLNMADRVTSTGGMVNYVKKSSKKEFIIGTEIGIIHRLQKENLNKIFYPASKQAICPDMKLINLEKLFWALEEEKYEVKLPEKILTGARSSIDKMISLT
jgi:quinolinate synthase